LAGLVVNKHFFILILLFFQLEIIFQLCRNFYIYCLKLIENFVQSSSLVTNNSFFYNIPIFIFIVTRKGNIDILFFYSFFIFLVIFLVNTMFTLYGYNTKYKLNIIMLINFFLFMCVSLFTTIDSLISFLFILELISVLYYFYFLNNYNLTKLNLLHYKNSLLFFLWNSFLTTVFFNLLMWYSLRYNGIISLHELNYFDNNKLFIILLIASISWKIGLPLFHFFKVELYKFLVKESLFMFSMVSTIINIFILLFVISQYFVYSMLLSYSFFSLILLSLLGVIFVNLNITNFLYFLAYSGLITLSTVLALTLI
jgi:hypothetical protein